MLGKDNRNTMFHDFDLAFLTRFFIIRDTTHRTQVDYHTVSKQTIDTPSKLQTTLLHMHSRAEHRGRDGDLLNSP